MNGYIRLLIGCVLLVVTVGVVHAEEDAQLIPFYPVKEKARELAIVELVRPGHREERYTALERAIFRNDWRPALMASNYLSVPGKKCTVEINQTGYAIGCYFERNGIILDEKYVQVQAVEEVIAFIKEFSKAKMAPLPRQPKKEKKRVSA